MKRYNTNQDDQDTESWQEDSGYQQKQKYDRKKSVEDERIEKRIESDCYDTEAWAILLQDPSSMDAPLAKKAFERCLSIFPTAVCAFIFSHFYKILFYSCIHNN